MSEQLTNNDVIQLLKLWKTLFGSKLKSSEWDINTVKVWTIALNDLQITPEEFATAQRKSLTLSWPPTAPADFLELGRGKPTDNYPDMRQAYLDQANLRTDCPIAYETARRVGFSTMREQPERVSYPLWQKHYKDVCIEHTGGKEFTKPQAQQIEYKTASEPASEAVASEMLANIRALLEEGQ